MKEIFIIWITFQLIMIGTAFISVRNEVYHKTYNCEQTKDVPMYIGIIFPLAVFVPDHVSVINYCNTK